MNTDQNDQQIIDRTAKLVAKELNELSRSACHARRSLNLLAANEHIATLNKLFKEEEKRGKK